MGVVVAVVVAVVVLAVVAAAAVVVAAAVVAVVVTLSLTTVGSGDLRGQTNMETCKEPITGEHRVSWFEPQGPQKTLTWKHFGQGGGS